MSLFDTQSLFPLKSKESVYTRLRFPVQPDSILLKRDYCQNLLDTLQVILPKSLYLQYYYPAIKQLANYVQILPAKQYGIFSEIQSLLDYSLSCATYTLITGLNHLYAHQKDFYKLQYSPMRTVELYAAFTAALFKNMDLLIQYYEISLYDKHEKKIKTWNPFEGSIIDTPQAAFISFKYIEQPRHLHLVNGALCSVILSQHPTTRSGFLSITEYPNILEYWLAGLNDEMYRIPSEVIISFLPFGEKKAFEKRREVNYLTTNAQCLSYDRQNYWGERFLHWLQKKADKDQLIINSTEEKGVRRIKEGILISEFELENFSRENQVSVELVKKQFHEIVVSYSNHPNARANQTIGGVRLTNWLLVYNPALIFGIGRLPSLFLGHHSMQAGPHALNSTRSIQ